MCSRCTVALLKSPQWAWNPWTCCILESLPKQCNAWWKAYGLQDKHCTFAQPCWDLEPKADAFGARCLINVASWVSWPWVADGSPYKSKHSVNCGCLLSQASHVLKRIFGIRLLLSLFCSPATKVTIATLDSGYMLVCLSILQHKKTKPLWGRKKHYQNTRFKMRERNEISQRLGFAREEKLQINEWPAGN